ncbi:MAG TPA: hypothetical protein VFK86_13615 [Bauldia sp.]|nr:hypothetical protein [Bauldia sp.]
MATVTNPAHPAPQMAVRLEKALGGSADVWMRMQINYDLAQAHKINVRRLTLKAA